MVRGFAVLGFVVVVAGGVFADGVTSATVGGGLPSGKLRWEKFPVTGKVTDEAGAPLTATITYSGNSSPTGASRAKGLFGSTRGTDSEGSFTLQMDKDSEGVVFATKAGYVVDYKILKDPSDNIDLVLKQEGRKLGGKVVDAEGKLVPYGVLAVVANTREVSEMTGKPWAVGNAITKIPSNAHGNYIMDNLPALPLTVWAANAGDPVTLNWAPKKREIKPNVDLKDSDNLSFDVVVEPTIKLSPEEESAHDIRIREHQDRIQELIKQKRAEREALKK